MQSLHSNEMICPLPIKSQHSGLRLSLEDGNPTHRAYVECRSEDAPQLARAAEQAAPLARLPAWLVHTEQGSASGATAALAAALPVPAYGLSLCAKASAAPSLNALAAAYTEVCS